MPELNGAFEEHFDGYRPELVIVGGGVVSEKIADAVLPLHSREDGAGYLGEIGEFLFEMFIFFRLRDEVDIGQGMRHFMQPDIAVGRLAGDAPHEIVPGQIDAGLVDMAHKRAGIEPVVIIVAEDEDIVEIVKLELIEAKGELHGGGADQDGHFGRLFHLYIMKVLRMLEEPGAKEEFALFFQAEAVVIPEMTGDHRVVKRLFPEKSFELMFCVKSLKK